MIIYFEILNLVAVEMLGYMDFVDPQYLLIVLKQVYYRTEKLDFVAAAAAVDYLYYSVLIVDDLMLNYLIMDFAINLNGYLINQMDLCDC